MKGDDDSEEEDTLSLYCLLIVVLDVSRIVDGRLFVSSLKRSIESSICRQGQGSILHGVKDKIFG